MGITRSFNKHNGVYYAYETVYEWSEEKQKKVQKKRCIGQFVPGTDEIIPNGARGKKPLIASPVIRTESAGKPVQFSTDTIHTFEEIRAKLETLEELFMDMSALVRDIRNDLSSYSADQEQKR